MAVFCNCQKFFNKSKPEHLQPVIEQFAKFKKEQREKQQIRRKDMKRTLKQLNGCSDGAIIRKLFSDQYFEEFPEEKTSMTSEEFISNLEDDINSTNSESDSESSSSSNNSSTSEEWEEQLTLQYEIKKLSAREWSLDINNYINTQMDDVTPAV